MKKIQILIPMDLEDPKKNQWKRVAVLKDDLIQLLNKKSEAKKEIKSDRIFPAGNKKFKKEEIR